MDAVGRANSLDAYWMPFTPNRAFKADPRMLARAEGMYYFTADGRPILDGTSGLWCVAAGHNRPRIVEAIRRAAGELDYAHSFNMGHPVAFELAARLAGILPEGLDRVFFTNSGSESCDTALKIALTYQKARGKPGKYRLIGRERGYHGVNFGGISVGGIVTNRKMFGTLLTGVDHLPHTHTPGKNQFTRGERDEGANLADELERIVTLHDASTIAAVIVEPVACSTGVLVPPKGYLKRLAAICAKGLTNGTIPMGAVLVTSEIHDAFMQGPEHMIEFMHGYTYSGNPVAAAAGLGTLETYRDEGLLTRGASLAKYWEDALHSLKGLPHVIDIRNLGLIGAVELEPIAGSPTKRAFSAFVKGYEQGILIRTTGDIIAMSPPLIVEKSHIDTLIGKLAEILKTLE
jgi:beta-alanine--pyruvate transaminase